jgi:holo-[acyl-carrier protein] synthase
MPVGVDVVSVRRIERDMERWGNTFLERVLTPAEAAWCASEHDGPTRVAACLAAKESVIKVLGGKPRGFTWRSVELVPNADIRATSSDRVPRARARAAVDALVLHEHNVVVGRWATRLGGSRIEAAAMTRGDHVVAVAAD